VLRFFYPPWVALPEIFSRMSLPRPSRHPALANPIALASSDAWASPRQMSFSLGFQIDALTPPLLGPIQVGHVAALVGLAVGAAVVGDDVSMSRAGSLMRGHLVECWFLCSACCCLSVAEWCRACPLARSCFYWVVFLSIANLCVCGASVVSVIV
jgi:hypothetical protein